METHLEVKLVLKLTFSEYCSITSSLEKEVNRLAKLGATALCDEARQLLDKLRESFLNGHCYEN